MWKMIKHDNGNVTIINDDLGISKHYDVDMISLVSRSNIVCNSYQSLDLYKEMEIVGDRKNIGVQTAYKLVMYTIYSTLANVKKINKKPRYIRTWKGVYKV